MSHATSMCDDAQCALLWRWVPPHVTTDATAPLFLLWPPAAGDGCACELHREDGRDAEHACRGCAAAPLGPRGGGECWLSLSYKGSALLNLYMSGHL